MYSQGGESKGHFLLGKGENPRSGQCPDNWALGTARQQGRSSRNLGVEEPVGCPSLGSLLKTSVCSVDSHEQCL